MQLHHLRRDGCPDGGVAGSCVHASIREGGIVIPKEAIKVVMVAEVILLAAIALAGFHFGYGAGYNAAKTEFEQKIQVDVKELGVGESFTVTYNG